MADGFECYLYARAPQYIEEPLAQSHATGSSCEAAQIVCLCPAYLQAGAILEFGDQATVWLAPKGPDVIEIDDMRAMDAHEAPRIQALLKVIERQMQQMLRISHMGSHVVAYRLKPGDVGHG